MGTVIVGTSLNVRGFAVGAGKLRSAASSIAPPIQQVTGHTRHLTIGLNASTRGFETLGNAARAATGAISAVGGAVMAVGRTLSTVSLIGGLFGVSIIQSTMEWRKQINQSRAVTEASAEEWERLEELIFELGSSTKFTIMEVAGAVDFLGKAGNSAVEQLSLLPVTLDLAAAANLDLPRTADLVTNIAKGFNIPIKEIARIGDVLTSVFLNSNVTLEMMAASLQKLGPLASATGAKFEDVAILVGLLGNAGVQAEQAGTHLRRMFVNLGDAGSQMRSQVVKDLGMTWEQLSILERGLIPVVSDIADRLLDDEGMWKGMKEQELGQRLFGTRAVSSVIAGLRGLGSGYDELADKVDNAAGKTAETAAAQIKGLEPIYRFQAAWTRLKITIGESGVFDTFTSILERLTELFNKLADATDETKRLAFGILAVVTVGGPFLILLGFIITMVGRIGQAFFWLGSVVGFLLTPLGLLTAAILTVVGAVGYMAIKGVEKFQHLWDGSSPFITALSDIILGMIAFVAAAIDGDWTTAWGHAKDVIANAGMLIVMVLGFIVNTAFDVFKEVLRFTVEHWDAIVNAIMKALDWLTGEVEGWLVLFVLFMFKGFRNLAMGLARMMIWAVNQIMRAFIWLAGRTGLLAYMQRIADGLWMIWNLLWTNITQMLRQALSFILTKFKSFATFLLGPWKKLGVFLWKVMLVSMTNMTRIISAGLTRSLMLFRKFTAVLSTAWAAISLILANPVYIGIGLITGAIVALAVILKDELWDGMQGVGNVLVVAIAKFLGGPFEAFVDSLGQTFSSVGGGMLAWLRGAWKDVEGFGGKLAKLVERGFTRHKLQVDAEGNVRVPDDTKEWLSKQGFVVTDPEPGRSWIDEAFKQGAGRYPGEVGADAWKKMKDAGAWIYNHIVEPVWSFTTEGLNAAWSWLKDDMPDLPGQILTALKDIDFSKLDNAVINGISRIVFDAFKLIGKLAVKLGEEVIAPVTKKTIETMLGVVGYALKHLSSDIQKIEQLVDVDPEKVKRDIYAMLESLGIDPEKISPEDEVEGGGDVLPAPTADTPEARRKSALEFVTNLANDLKTKLSDLFKQITGDEQKLNEENVEEMLKQMGFDVDQMKRTADKINDVIGERDPRTLTGDGIGAGGGSSVGRSLTGALSDLTLNVNLYIGDEAIEDIVVKSLFSARRGGRLQGLTP